jgi:hypothetical protein
VLFLAYPALRPWHDEGTVAGATASMSSTAWVAAHFFAMLGFILMPLGLLALRAGTPDLAAVVVDIGVRDERGALKLSRYQRATPETLWRDFLDATGTLHIGPAGVTCALNLRSHHPALIDAGFADLQTPVPWWGGRILRFRFPPR